MGAPFFALSISFAEAATDQKLGMLLRMHEMAFRQRAPYRRRSSADRVKRVWTGTDERSEIIWNSVFLGFSGHCGFTRGCAVRTGRRRKERSIGCEVHTAELPVRAAGPGTGQCGRLQRGVTLLGSRRCQSARPRHNMLTGAVSVRRRSVRDAAVERALAHNHDSLDLYTRR